MAPEVTGTEEQNIMSPVRNISSELESEKKAVTPEARASPRMAGFLGMRNEPSVDAASQVHSLMRSPSEYFPMIRRGGPNAGEELNDDEQSVMAVGWKVEVTNRKEREEALRDEVRRFEVKMKKFYPNLEEGIDVTLWQLNRHADVGNSGDDFTMKSSPVTLKLHRRGDLLVQAVLTFSTVGGYLSKALGRNKREPRILEHFGVLVFLSFLPTKFFLTLFLFSMWNSFERRRPGSTRSALTQRNPGSKGRVYWL